MTYSIVIPCWNEEKTIGRAVLETRAFFESLAAPFEIIVVDDGSADRTAETVQNLSKEIPELRLIRHEKNLGKGAAVKTGVAAASGEWILFLDADLSTHPSAFKKFLPHLAEADIVIGSRRSSGGNIAEPQPWMREKFGQLFNLTVRLLFRLPYRDTQCGFKAIR